MYSETGNVPAKLIKEFRKKSDKPLLKGALLKKPFILVTIS
jgi:large subunit ribosomal protein L10